MSWAFKDDSTIYVEHRCLDIEGNRPDAQQKKGREVDSIILIEPSESGRVRYVTGRASLHAATLDGDWFADNPRERIRIRAYQPSEFGLRWPEQTFFPLIVVVKVGYGQRISHRLRGASPGRCVVNCAEGLTRVRKTALARLVGGDQ